jgi:hypothetical protein
LAGDVITTAGALPRVTVIDAEPTVPLVQDTVIVFEPSARARLFVVALVEATPFTVQVVPDGIEAAPLTVYDTFVFGVPMFAPFAGEVIATTGAGGVRVTVTEAVPVAP